MGTLADRIRRGCAEAWRSIQGREPGLTDDERRLVRRAVLGAWLLFIALTPLTW